MKKKKGNFLMMMGLLLLAAALGLAGYNIYESKRAQAASDNILKELSEIIVLAETENVDDSEEIPNYVEIPEKEMPSVESDGERYIGILEIPDIGLRLPVMGGEWSYNKLNIAPCRYSGSVYENSMVIAAHNYSSHFGKIGSLGIGTQIRFTDIDGNVFEYTAGWAETLQSIDVEEMKGGEDWDLTLFTCTYSGRERYTLRCILNQ